MTEKINTEEILKVIPLGKLGSCTQIANLVSFLVSSDAGSYITGQTISIDGGMSTVSYTHLTLPTSFLV